MKFSTDELAEVEGCLLRVPESFRGYTFEDETGRIEILTPKLVELLARSAKGQL